MSIQVIINFDHKGNLYIVVEMLFGVFPLIIMSKETRNHLE